MPPETWEEVVDLYCVLCGDETVAIRARAHYLIVLVWWVARLTRMGYELSCGKERNRLVASPKDQRDTLQALTNRYLDRARAALS